MEKKEPAVRSHLNVLDTETGEVRTLRSFDGVIEAPNWLRREGKLLYNAGGRIYTCDLCSGEVAAVDTGFCTGCNNDHVIAPDETHFAVSHGGMEDGVYVSRIYVIPFGGGAPRLVTPNTPSFLHGWSPDGKELCYCAFREPDGAAAVDIYSIPVEGGEERRLTDGGFNDGPEYSPDGAYIWYNSTRGGSMQIWRMRRDGSGQAQMTDDGRYNWFPHVAPDGKKLVYLSYRREDLAAEEHLANLPVELWMMDTDGGNARRLLPLFGGQGTINVNSWAADSRRLAFVSYELL